MKIIPVVPIVEPARGSFRCKGAAGDNHSARQDKHRIYGEIYLTRYFWLCISCILIII